MRHLRLASIWGLFAVLFGIFSLSFPLSSLEAQSCLQGGTPPCVTQTRPANGETNVCTNEDITADISVPPLEGNGVNAATLSTSTVYLKRTDNPGGAAIPATYNTTGGNDAFTLSPDVDLDPNTSYTYTVTSGLKDLFNNSFSPYTMTFTTGAGNCGGDTPVRFARTVLTTDATGWKGKYTSLAIGPDNRLYAAMVTGLIRIFDINSNGTIALDETLTFYHDPNNLANNRPVIGMAFDPASTPTNIILWVTNNNALYQGVDYHFSGRIDKLVGTNINQGNETWTKHERITGLPRARKDHLANSLAFGPDGALYLTQGSISAMGAPDAGWGFQPETLLAGAVLRIDVAQLEQRPNLPLNVATGTANPADQKELLNNYGFGEIPDTLYDPQKPNAPLTVYASGVRNAYDLLWHSNGQLYVPTNGSAAGGNAPAFPANRPVACDLRIDGEYDGPENIPAANNIETQKDYLFRVEATGYYGHPNPKRCEWVLNGGNPTSNPDPAEILKYPVGIQPDPNWRGFTFDFGYNRSANGVIEYKTNIYEGALRGWILVVRYSNGNDIVALKPSGNGLSIEKEILIQNTQGVLALSNPLDLIEDTRNGNIYVAEYESELSLTNGRISILRPVNANAAPIAKDDLYTTNEDEPITVNAANGVLANDSDLNGDAMTAFFGEPPSSLVPLPPPSQNGTVTLNADGSFTYTPNAGFTGADTFKYYARDSKGDDSAAATVTINVLPAGETPTNTPTNEPETDTPTPFPTDTATETPNPLTPSATPTPTDTATHTPDPLTPSPTFTPTSTEIVNLVINGDFEATLEDAPDLLPWKLKNSTGDDKIKCNKDKDGDGIADKIFGYIGSCAFRFKGGAGENAKLQQVLDIAPVAPGDSLNLHFYAEGKSVVLDTATAQLKVRYSDDNKEKVLVTLPEGEYPYTAFSGVLPMTGTPAKLKLQFRYRGTEGKVLVDAVVTLVNVTPPSVWGKASDIIPLPLPGN
jgi:hypothetical protein